MRTVPAALQAHLEQPVTTTCRLLKIKLKDGSEHGLTNLDTDVVYQGVTYSAINGFDSSVIASDASFGVDNAEGFALLSADVPGITLEMVEVGKLDDATWEALLVNYRDLSMGHILLDAGDLGEVRVVDDTVYIPELLSYAMRLRQSIGHVDSKTCRAIFGSPAASQTGCGVDAEALWVNLTVTSAGDEPRIVFFADADSPPFPYTDSEVVPGRVEWLSGNNQSARQYQIEAASVGTNGFRLLEPTPFDIAPGDTLRLRPDCDKLFETCRDRWDNALEFKGENLIPINDGTAAQTPGASV